ncbi:MAG: ABC transporter permease [Candidatus Cyclobacteriaceae bacterium M3_2C_046]
MIKNYFITALRNLKRHKIFSFINIISLGVSMTIGLLIILMLSDQKRYDQFHENKHQIYRITSERSSGSNPYATSPMPVVEELKNYEGLEQSVALSTGIGGDVKYNNLAIPMAGFFTNPEFFSIFSFELEKGNPATALQKPHSIILNHEMAVKLFGEEDPLGKVVSFDERGLDIYGFWFDIKKANPWGEFVVTGVLKKPPYKSHLKFDMLVSAATIPVLENKDLKQFPDEDWNNYYSNYSYVLLPKGKTREEVKQILSNISDQKYPNPDELKLNFDLQALTSITPGPVMNNMSSITLPSVVYYVLSFLALVVILLASFNYTNLSIARSLTRAKEVGVRKVSGATRKQLIFQFLGESILVALISLLFAILLLYLIKPAFMSLWVNQYLDFNLQENLWVYAMFLLFAVIIGTVAGIIPGIYLSKFKPVSVLSKFIKVKPTDIPILKKLSLYKMLVISQFSIALFFMITTILIFRQIEHFVTMDYGFNPNNIINVELQGNDFNKVKQQFQSIANVESIGSSEYIVCSGISQGFRLKKDEEDEGIRLNSMIIDPEFIEIMDIELLAGRNFDDDINQEQEKFIIVNQKTLEVLEMETPMDIIGKSYLMDETNVTVIGVVNDFVYHLPFTAMEPFAFRYNPQSLKYANIKLTSSESAQNTLQQMQAAWKVVDPVHPFEYKFFEEQMTGSYQLFNDIGKIIGFIAFLAIAISCFGLLGITTFSTESRLKEVGVRKVMGAKLSQIIFTLSKSLVLLVLISIVITTPFAYIVNNLWLQEMVNKTSFSFDIILIGVMLTLLLGLISVIFQTIKVAQTNPVVTLKSE